jgi:hypothetical protein
MIYLEFQTLGLMSNSIDEKRATPPEMKGNANFASAFTNKVCLIFTLDSFKKLGLRKN